MVRSSFFHIDEETDEYTDVESAVTIKHCSGDDDYPIEIMGTNQFGDTIGIDLNWLDTIRLYSVVAQAILNLYKEEVH